MRPKTEIVPHWPGYTLYYCGLEIFDSNNILGKRYYKVVVSEGNLGYWVTFLSAGGINSYHSYKGFYASGQLKEEGEIFVEYFDFDLPPKPLPDRHIVWNGRYYKPDGTLGSEISQGTGTQTLWFSNGQIQWELELIDAVRVRHKHFREDGTIISSAEYVDGVPVREICVPPATDKTD